MIDKDMHSHHISQQFNEELDVVKSEMLEMGGLVEKQVSDAVSAFITTDTGIASVVREGDRKINNMEVHIDDQCARILARRQPAASDLRLVIAISKVVNDLERIGDEAAKIARQAIELSEVGDIDRGQVEVRHIGQRVGEMVRSSLDSFARMDGELALQVAQEDKSVDREYATAMRSLVTYMMEDPRKISQVLNTMWTLRSLERVGDHARNIAEHVIYLVKGKNVRHIGLEEMAEEVRRS
jgi:phosphate transport system protein